MKRNDQIRRRIKAILCIMCLLLTGCSAIGLAQETTFESAYENGEEEPGIIYSSAAFGIVDSIDEENQTITFYLPEQNGQLTLNYTGATMIQDRYGTSLTAHQLECGSIVDITYDSELEKAGSVCVSPDSWSYEDVVKYQLDVGNGNMSIGDEIYDISKNVKAYSDGQAVTLEQLIHQDTLSFRGKGHTVLSVVVDKGHGYLDLENEDAVLGGWIEIGQTVISQIAPDMLFTVPEGSYLVRFTFGSNNSFEEIREVLIERNRETVLDLGDIKIPKSDNGRVIFEIEPASAAITVDDIKIDTTYPVRLPLGLHQITASASGYDTVSEYFRVEEEGAVVRMKLSQSSQTVSGNSLSSWKKAQITIEAGNGTEVYEDNLYKGLSPVTYDKTAGDHTITLRKAGYLTRSYDITVTDDGRDITYSFPDLEPDDGRGSVSGNQLLASPSATPSGMPGSVSGNTISGNQLEGSASATPTVTPVAGFHEESTATPYMEPTATPDW